MHSICTKTNKFNKKIWLFSVFDVDLRQHPVLDDAGLAERGKDTAGVLVGPGRLVQRIGRHARRIYVLHLAMVFRHRDAAPGLSARHAAAGPMRGGAVPLRI